MASLLRRRVAIVVMGAFVVTITACVVSDFAEGQYTCNPDGDTACPPGLLCARDGLCRAHDVEAGTTPITPEAAADVMTDTADASDAFDPCSSATWVTLVDGRTPLSVALSGDGRLYAGGQANGTQAWIAELDSCDGSISKESLFDIPGGAKANVSGLVVTPTTDVGFCGGSSDPAGVFGRSDNTGAPTARQSVAGAGISGFTRAAVATDGAVWFSGAKNIFGAQDGWVIRTVGATKTCELTVGETAVVTTASDGTVYVIHYPSGGAPQVSVINEQCVLGASVGEALAIGTNALGVANLIAAPGVFYAAGNVNSAPTNSFAWFSVLDRTTGKWTSTTVDPNPAEADLLQSAGFDTRSIFLGVNERAGFGTGRPTMYRFDPPFLAASKPAALGLPFGAVQIALRDIAVAALGKDGVYVVAGSLQDSGGIARCRKNGECPK